MLSAPSFFAPVDELLQPVGALVERHVGRRRAGLHLCGNGDRREALAKAAAAMTARANRFVFIAKLGLRIRNWEFVLPFYIPNSEFLIFWFRPTKGGRSAARERRPRPSAA